MVGGRQEAVPCALLCAATVWDWAGKRAARARLRRVPRGSTRGGGRVWYALAHNSNTTIQAKLPHGNIAHKELMLCLLRVRVRSRAVPWPVCAIIASGVLVAPHGVFGGTDVVQWPVLCVPLCQGVSLMCPRMAAPLVE